MQKYIRRGTHRSTLQLELAIEQYIKINNSDPQAVCLVQDRR